jgi:PAS domain S-box-containing protein
MPVTSDEHPPPSAPAAAATATTSIKPIVLRYAFSVAVIVVAFTLKKLLEPVTGTGAPFVLFFGAVVAASVWGGVGPGVCATLLSLPLGAYVFVVRAGYMVSQAVTQASLFAVDGLVVVYLSYLITRARRAAEASEARWRDLLELAPDAFFLADLAGRFSDVNQSACRLLGYQREELIGTTIAEMIPPEDVPRLAKVREALLDPGRVERGEWRLRHKSGRFVPVEVTAKILPGGRWQALARDISERKRTDDERQVFVSLLENSPDFIGIADPNGTPIYLNPAGRRMVGLPADYPVEQTRIPDYYPPEERGFAADVIVKAMVERGRWSGETHFRHWQTQEAIPVSDEHFMIFDPGGQRVLGMGTVTRDISEARRSERALRLSEARFSGIISISADAIISIDEAQNIILFNDGAERIFGYSRAEAIGAPLDILIPESARAAHRRHVAAFAAGPMASRRMGNRLMTIKGRRKNGEEFPAEAAISKLAFERDTILTVALRDVTERQRVEDEQRFLADAGAVLATSLDYEPTLANLGRLMVRDFADLCLVDLVEDANRPRRLKVVGARPDQASLCVRLEQLDLDRRRPHLALPVLQSQRSFLLEHVTSETLASLAQSEDHLRLLRAVAPRSIIGVPLLAHGDLLGVLTLISTRPSRAYGAPDVRLAEAIAERAALAIENGHHYQIALRATRLRDEVLGIVAHDLRNPLAAITMQATALQHAGRDADARSSRIAEAILRSGKRMDRLISDLLDVTLIESGQLSVQRGRVATRQLLMDAVEVQRPIASSASIELRLEAADDLPEVWGDQHRLLQVIENLVGNGIKFTPPDGRITVGAAPKDHHVLFWVADNGCGISPESLPRVFDRFWQAKKGARGAGLGLPIARGIIEAHGGRIWVESTPGRGTIVFFTVPEGPPAETHRTETMH